MKSKQNKQNINGKTEALLDVVLVYREIGCLYLFKGLNWKHWKNFALLLFENVENLSSLLAFNLNSKKLLIRLRLRLGTKMCCMFCIERFENLC